MDQESCVVEIDSLQPFENTPAKKPKPTTYSSNYPQYVFVSYILVPILFLTVYFFATDGPTVQDSKDIVKICVSFPLFTILFVVYVFRHFISYPSYVILQQVIMMLHCITWICKVPYTGSYAQMQTHYWCFSWYAVSLYANVLQYEDYFRGDDSVDNVAVVYKERKYYEKYGVSIVLYISALIVFSSMGVVISSFIYDVKAPQVCEMCAKIIDGSFDGSDFLKTEDFRRKCIRFMWFNCV